MITIGRSVRWHNSYGQEVEFSRQNGFDFMQIWFQKGELNVDTLPKPKEKYIKENGYPVIIHAVFDVGDFEKYGGQLIALLQYLEHKEVIIHPICKEQEISENTIYMLSKNIRAIADKLEKLGIILYIENNSVIDTIFYQPADLSIVFTENKNIELLLDVAHIDSYEHLQGIISIKYPKCLHIADKHFNAKHEHLPLNKGDLNYKLIFSRYLQDFDGRIILEIPDEDPEIIQSKRTIDEAIELINRNKASDMSL